MFASQVLPSFSVSLHLTQRFAISCTNESSCRSSGGGGPSLTLLLETYSKSCKYATCSSPSIMNTASVQFMVWGARRVLHIPNSMV